MKIRLLTIFFLSIVTCFTAQVDITPDQLPPSIASTISSSDSRSDFGSSISFSSDGETIAVGSTNYYANTPNRGRVQIFEKNSSGNWIQKGLDLEGINDLYNEFGSKVVLSSDGNRVAILDSQLTIILNAGETLEDKLGTTFSQYFPYIQVYEFDNGTWNKLGNDILLSISTFDSGFDFSKDGSTIAIGTGIGIDFYNLGTTNWEVVSTITSQPNSNHRLFSKDLAISENGNTVIFEEIIYTSLNVGDGDYIRKVEVHENTSGNWVQKGTSIINNTDYQLIFGNHVAISNDGETVAFSNLGDNADDFITVYSYLGGSWVQKGNNIITDDSGIEDLALSGDGNKMIVLDDETRILEYTSDWTQKNQPITTPVVEGTAFPSIAINDDGNTFAVGSTKDDFVNIYVDNNNSITRHGEEQYGYGIYDRFGSSIALSDDGNIIAVGANGAYNNSGTLYYSYVKVYQKTDTGLEQIGNDLRNTSDFDAGSFGSKVALSGDGKILAVSARYLGTSNYGGVYVYKRVGNSWTSIGEFYGSTYDGTGTSIALSDDGYTLAVGSIINAGGASSNSYTGFTTVYKYNEAAKSWSTLGNQIDGESSRDFSGESIDISGDGTIVAIGAKSNDGETTSGAHGHTRVFKFDGNSWVQMGADIDGDPSFNVDFGEIVNLSNDGLTLLVGDSRSNSLNGSIELFNWNATNSQWEKEFQINGVETDGLMETAKISNDKRVLVASAYDANSVGKIYVYYKNNEGTWIDSQLFLKGTKNGNQYFGGGFSLSANGNTLAIRSSGHNQNGFNSGMAALYHLDLSSSLENFENFNGVEPIIYPEPDNLLENPSAELVPFTDNGWVEATGDWTWPIRQTTSVAKQDGIRFFRTNTSGSNLKISELYQDVDVSSFSTTIDASGQNFYFSAYMRTFSRATLDDSQAIVEYRAADETVLASYDTGLSRITNDWEQFENTQLAPSGTRTIRVRLLVHNNNISTAGAFIDNVVLKTALGANDVVIPDDNFEAYLESINVGNGIVGDNHVAKNLIANVTSLNLYDKAIVDVTGIEYFTSLTFLDITDIGLSQIDISSNIQLETLIADYNQFVTIDLSKNTKLKRLEARNNVLTNLDISALVDLEILELEKNQLTNIDFEFNTKLTILDLKDNQIEHVNLSYQPQIFSCELQNNLLQSLNLQSTSTPVLSVLNTTNNPSLTCIQVLDVSFYNTFLNDVDAQTDFYITCPNTTVAIPDDNFEAYLESINAGNGVVGDNLANIAALETVTIIDLISSPVVNDLTGIEYCTNLTFLRASNNSISQVDVSNNTLLEEIYIANNQISTIDFTNNINLKKIDVSENQLTAIDVHLLTALESLSCYKNQLTEINLISNDKLQAFLAAENQLIAADLRENENLVWLDVDDNKLESLLLKNGNNNNVIIFSATENPNLSCIEVDDVAYSKANWTEVDSIDNFSLECAPPNDICSRATPLVFEQNTPGEVNAGDINTIPACVNGTVVADVWYSVEIPQNGEFSIQSISGFGGTVKFALYESCAAQNEIACGETIALAGLTVGNVYYIKVWLESSGNPKTASETGSFTILAQPTQVLSTNQYEESSHFTMYPNPANNRVTINSSSENIKNIALYTVLGKRVYQEKNINAIKSSLQVSNFPKGVYFIKITTDTKKIIQKLIIN